MSFEEIIRGLEDTARLFDNMRKHQPEMGGSGTAGILRAAIEKLKTHQDNQPNEPLTPEELREMRGKERQPLWIRQYDEGGSEGFWALARVSGDRLRTHYGGWFSLDDYGKTWIAYRRSQKEATP